MSEKHGVLSSMLKQKCPQCRTENLFLYPSYSWRFLRMHKECPNCKMNLDPEPGFYWGAMYISYGFNTALVIISSIVLYFLFNNPKMEVYLAVILGINVLLTPLIFRLSRVILIYSLGKTVNSKNN